MLVQMCKLRDIVDAVWVYVYEPRDPVGAFWVCAYGLIDTAGDCGSVCTN
jgi:hypothetical protein